MTNEITTPKATAPAHAGEGDLMQMIYQAAKDPDFDADKMDKIIGMKERMDDREAKKAYYAAMVEFNRDPPRIIKNMAVNFGNTSYKHASIDSVMRQLKEAMNPLKLFPRWKVSSNAESNIVTVTAIVSHVDGYSEESTMEDKPDNSGKKNSIQGAGSTVTYLKRYTILSVLGLAEQGEDDDGAQAQMAKAIGQEQVEDLQKLIEAAGSSVQAVCKRFKVDSLSALSNAQYGAVVGGMKAKKAQPND